MKAIIKIIILLFVLFTLTACGRTEKETGSSLIDKPVMYGNNLPKHISTKLGEGFIVDADVITPWNKLPNKMGTVKVKKLEFNYEKVKNIFLPTAIEDRKYFEVYKDESGNKCYDKMYKTKNEKYLNIYGSGINFVSPLCKYIDNSVFSDVNSGQYNLSHYKTGDLAFMSKQTVTDKVKKTLCSLGIKVCNRYKVYSLDHKIMKEEEVLPEDIPGKKPEKKKPNWTVDDDCYYFQFNQEINGVPLSNSFFGSSTKKNTIYGPTIECIYGKDGWVKVNISNIYNLININNDEKQIIDLNKALEKIKDTYAILPNGGSGLDYTKINKISFCYIPQFQSADNQNIELIPAWSFSCSVKYENELNEHVNKKPIVVNAINGKIIV